MEKVFSLFYWSVEATFSRPPTAFPETFNWNRNGSMHSLSCFEKTP